MANTTAYVEILLGRMEHFKDKKITDLTDEEIQEFIALRNEIIEVFPEVRKAITEIWEAIEPYYEAGKLYQERVIKR